MYYISRKIGNKYGVVDTSDNVEEFYNLKQLRKFYDNGIEIQGVCLIRNRFVVTPYKNIDNNMILATKNQFLTGDATSYPGFNLDLRRPEVIFTEPLKDEFYEYIMKNKLHDGFVLVIPDMVSIICKDFLNPKGNMLTSRGVNLCIVLPKSVKVIQSDALNHYLISKIIFNGVLSRVESSSDRNGSLRLERSWLDDDNFYVKQLEAYSIFLSNCTKLKLPLIEFLACSAIIYNSSMTPLSVYIGKGLKKLYNFIKPLGLYNDTSFSNESSDTKKLMSRAIIVYLEDVNSLEEIDLTLDERQLGLYDRCLSSYIFVAHTSHYNRLASLLSKSLDNSTAVGIMTYENDTGKSYLEEHLYDYCLAHTKYFKEYLEVGDIRLLHLK